MRTGAIFARGSCRALKWMALLGMVFVLGVGTAAAQVTFTIDDKVDEGDRVMVEVGGTVPLAVGVAGVVTITATAAPVDPVPAAPLTAGEEADSAGFTTLTIRTSATTAEGSLPVSGSFEWLVGTDLDAEDEVMTLTWSASGTGNATGASVDSVAPATPTKNVTIEDRDTQSFVWDPAAPTLKEAGMVAVTLRADPPPVDLTHSVTLAVDAGYVTRNPDDDADLSSHDFTATADEVDFLLKAPSNDANREDDMITLQARGTTVTPLAELSINVADIHGLPDAAAITAKAYDMMTGGTEVMSVEEGDTVYLEVTVDRGTGGYPDQEPIKVALSLSDSSLATLGVAMVEVPAGTGDKMASARVELNTTEINTFPQAEEIVVLLTASGTVAANGAVGSVPGTPLTLALTDETEKRIWALDGAMDAIYAAMNAAKGSDGKLNPDDDFSISNSMLFGTMTGYTASVKAVPSTAAVSIDDSGDSVMVMPDGAGMAKITITGTAVPAASSFQATQLSTDSAQIMFEVTVEAADTTAPAAPAAPTVTATANIRRSLDVMWETPADGGSAILDYGVRYKMSSASDWTTKENAVTGTSTKLPGLSDATMYDVQVRARNANDSGPWSSSGQGRTLDGPEPPSTTLADITKIELSGAEERSIGGVKRLHLDEGDTSTVTVTVEWTVAQLREIYAADATPDPVYVDLDVRSEVDGASWLSGAEVLNEVGQDVPDSFEWVRIDIPKKPKTSARDRETVKGMDTTSLALLQDVDAEDEGFRLVVTSSSSGVSVEASRSMIETDMLLVIDDDEKQGIKLKQTSKGDIYEGGADVEFEVTADPELDDLTIDVGFDLTDEDGAAVSSRVVGLNPARDSIGAGDDKIEVAVVLNENDGNRDHETFTLHAEIASRNRDDIEDASESFTVLDVHKLPPLTVTSTENMVEEGGEIELTLMLDRNPRDTIAIDPETRLYTSEPVDVMLMGMPKGIVEIMPSPAKFPKHDGKAPWKQEMKVKVSAPVNNDLDGDRMVSLDASIAGTIAANGMKKDEETGVASVTVKDGTAKLVWAKSPEEVEAAVMAAKKAGMGDDMMFTEGEMIELEGNDLFGSAEGVSVGYTAMVEGDAVSYSESGGVVTITADSMGMAKVTITARASRPSGAVVINDQTDPREASITIALEVGLVALSIELSGPEDMNIVEGGMGGMVTATANRAVTEDTVVNLMRDRAMSSAEDADFTAEPITIMAGQMKGSTMVMAVEDNMMENDDNMAEELVLYGMAADNAGEVTGRVKLYIWDAAVPALPVIAQLLLAALMAVGGYRRYRRR